MTRRPRSGRLVPGMAGSQACPARVVLGDRAADVRTIVWCPVHRRTVTGGHSCSCRFRPLGPMGMDLCARRRSRPSASKAIASSRAPGARSGAGWEGKRPKSAAVGSDKVMTRLGPPARAIASASTPCRPRQRRRPPRPARTRPARPAPYRTGVAPARGRAFRRARRPR